MQRNTYEVYHLQLESCDPKETRSNQKLQLSSLDQCAHSNLPSVGAETEVICYHTRHLGLPMFRCKRNLTPSKFPKGRAHVSALIRNS